MMSEYTDETRCYSNDIVEVYGIDNLKFSEGLALSFSARFEINPIIELPKYKKKFKVNHQTDDSSLPGCHSQGRQAPSIYPSAAPPLLPS